MCLGLELRYIYLISNFAVSVSPEFYNGGFNCLVHVFMYTYYGLAAMGPQLQPYLWWKRYLTEFQLVSSVYVFIPIS